MTIFRAKPHPHFLFVAPKGLGGLPKKTIVPALYPPSGKHYYS